MKNSVQAKQYPKIPSRTFPMQNISAQYHILSLEHNYSISNILQVKIKKSFPQCIEHDWYKRVKTQTIFTTPDNPHKLLPLQGVVFIVTTPLHMEASQCVFHVGKINFSPHRV